MDKKKINEKKYRKIKRWQQKFTSDLYFYNINLSYRLQGSGVVLCISNTLKGENKKERSSFTSVSVVA